MSPPEVPRAVQETDFTSDRVQQSANNGPLHQVAPEPDSEPTVDALSQSAPPAFSRTARLLAPDLLRGLLMVLQSIDHASVSASAWRHGQGLESESDGKLITAFNENVAWTARTLTHLAAPGFMFLLGFGVVLFGSSRAKLGWSASAMAWHFFIRAVVLTLACLVLGWALTQFRVWLMNAVLLALAVNYLLAGLLWMLLNATERTLTTLLETYLSPKLTAEETPLLSTEAQTATSSSRAASISFHVHNIMVAALSGITIAWNIWMSPTGGHCGIADQTVASPGSGQPLSGYGTAFDIWWYPVSDEMHGVMSAFPPLAWLSFAILGILYARIYTARAWPVSSVNVANAAAAVLFAAIFVATRLLRVGNLSEGCLKTPDQIAHPGLNPYLASFKSFFYVIKYPPDVAFWAYSMSVNFFLLAIFGAIPAKISTRIPGLLVFGKCALFFYVVHFVVFNITGYLAKVFYGKDLGYTDPFTKQPAYGTGDIPQFWASWIIGICVMYPMCFYYGIFKAKKSADSLWRFF